MIAHLTLRSENGGILTRTQGDCQGHFGKTGFRLEPPRHRSSLRTAWGAAYAALPNIKERTMTSEIKTPKAASLDMKFEIAVIPVSDVDRAKAFYAGLGWRLDADYASGEDYRVIQFTPPGSPASVIFGKNVTAAAPGSAKGLYLIVSDVEAARSELLSSGVEV